MAGPTGRVVSTTTPCSAFVQESAIRLFTSGYMAQLHYADCADGHLFFSIRWESCDELYRIDFDPSSRMIRCSCRAGQFGIPCKHVQLFRLSRGLGVEAVKQ